MQPSNDRSNTGGDGTGEGWNWTSEYQFNFGKRGALQERSSGGNTQSGSVNELDAVELKRKDAVPIGKEANREEAVQVLAVQPSKKPGMKLCNLLCKQAIVEVDENEQVTIKEDNTKQYKVKSKKPKVLIKTKIPKMRIESDHFDFENRSDFQEALALYHANDAGYPKKEEQQKIPPEVFDKNYLKRVEHNRVRNFMRDRSRRIDLHTKKCQGGTRDFPDSKVYFYYGKPPLGQFGQGNKADFVEKRGARDFLTYNIMPHVIPNDPTTQQTYPAVVAKVAREGRLNVKSFGAAKKPKGPIQQKKIAKGDAEYFVV